MPVNWKNSESQAALLQAILFSGLFSAYNKDSLEKIIAAWPKDRVAAPSFEGLKQHLQARRKEARQTPVKGVRGRPAASSTTPASSAPRGVARPSSKGNTSKTKTTPMEQSASEDEEEFDCKATPMPSSPTPAPRARQSTTFGVFNAPNGRTSILHASLIPSTGLTSPPTSNGKRKRNVNELAGIPIKKEHGEVVLIDSNDEEEDVHPDQLPMGQRTLYMKKKAIQEQRKRYGYPPIPTFENIADEHGY